MQVATVAAPCGTAAVLCSGCGLPQQSTRRGPAWAGASKPYAGSALQNTAAGSRKKKSVRLVSSLHGKLLRLQSQVYTGIKTHVRKEPITADWKELTGVLVLSAFPFLFVKYLAEGPTGDRLMENAQKTKAEKEPQKQEFQEKQTEARQRSRWYGPERPKWLGPLPYEYPGHLSGEYPADYGFDILNLGVDPSNFQKYFNFEILHARWAMLGALGALIPEVLQYFSALDFTEPVWWKVGYAKLQGEDLDYFGIPGLHIAGGQGILIIAFCQAILMLGPEYARATGIAALEPVGLYLPGDENFPGGALFDPLGLADDPEAFEDLKVKEMKNGRLAMVAWLGFYIQALVTQKGPLQNLLDFASDPAHNNIFTAFNSS